MNSLPRMRTARNVLEEIKRLDPHTEVTERFIRRIINSGAVPVVHVGRKKLVDVDKIQALLAAGYQPPEVEQQAGGIRKVAK